MRKVPSQHTRNDTLQGKIPLIKSLGIYSHSFAINFASTELKDFYYVLSVSPDVNNVFIE